MRKAKYDLDENEVKPYLQLEKLREGMFWVAGRSSASASPPSTGVPVYHPDVVVYEVKDAAGKHVGLWYFDPWARPGKRSGAWMNAYRDQERFDGDVPTIVSNNANFVKGAPGEPVLVSWDDASTMFHEFGHALHGLLSNVDYPSLSGTSVARDYVEFPSQILERWLATPEVLSRFALHYRTGQPMPEELAEKIERASTFRQGFDTVEYLASALVDMKLHLAGARPIDPDAFERETLAALGMPSEIVMRHRTPQFTHVFSGEGYAAGYYSYLWSDVLAADAWEAFTEAGGPWDEAVAKRLRESVFSVGNTIDPADGYRAFRGRDAAHRRAHAQARLPGAGRAEDRLGFRGPPRDLDPREEAVRRPLPEPAGERLRARGAPAPEGRGEGRPDRKAGGEVGQQAEGGAAQLAPVDGVALPEDRDPGAAPARASGARDGRPSRCRATRWRSSPAPRGGGPRSGRAGPRPRRRAAPRPGPPRRAAASPPRRTPR